MGGGEEEREEGCMVREEGAERRPSVSKVDKATLSNCQSCELWSQADLGSKPSPAIFSCVISNLCVSTEVKGLSHVLSGVNEKTHI